MPEPAGAVNVYRCRACDHEAVTINRDAGTTPFIIGCPSCGGEAVSQFYRVDQDLTPAWEWYRPRRTNRLPRAVREHVCLGGLLLRRVGDA